MRILCCASRRPRAPEKCRKGSWWRPRGSRHPSPILDGANHPWPSLSWLAFFAFTLSSPFPVPYPVMSVLASRLLAPGPPAVPGRRRTLGRNSSLFSVCCRPQKILERIKVFFDSQSPSTGTKASPSTYLYVPQSFGFNSTSQTKYNPLQSFTFPRVSTRAGSRGGDKAPLWNAQSAGSMLDPQLIEITIVDGDHAIIFMSSLSIHVLLSPLARNCSRCRSTPFHSLASLPNQAIHMSKSPPALHCSHTSPSHTKVPNDAFQHLQYHRFAPVYAKAAHSPSRAV